MKQANISENREKGEIKLQKCFDPVVCPIILPKISNEGNEKPQNINGSRELDMEQTTKFMAKKLN